MFELTPAGRSLIEEAGRQARRVFQKIGNGHLATFVATPLVEVRSHTFVERHCSRVG